MFNRKKDKIEFTEKGKEEITIRDASGAGRPTIDLTDAGSGGLLSFLRRNKGPAVAISGFAVFAFLAVLLFRYGRADDAPVPFEQHAIIETALDEGLPIEGYLSRLLRQEAKVEQLAGAARRLGVARLSPGTKALLYFERITDPEPYQARLFTGPQTSLLFAFEGEGRVELLSNKLLKSYIAERWVLEADMLDLMTGKSSRLKAPWELLSRTEEILSWSIGLRNLQKGDTLCWVWEAQKYEGDPSFRKASVAGLQLSARSLDTAVFAIRPAGSRDTAFYDYEGRPLRRQFLRSPVRYGRISSRYNLTRLNPVLKYIKAHKGTDFAAPEGAEVYALADGVVVKRGLYGPNGNYVKIRHDSIYATGYLHLSRFEDSVQPGDTVRQGQVIGYVGQTGSATGPHVCLRFWRRDFQDDFVHAFQYLPEPPALPLLERQQFYQTRDSILSAIRSLDD